MFFNAMGIEFYRKIITTLKAAQVPFEHFEHEHIVTSDDAAKVRGLSLTLGAKALVLETGNGKIVQCVVNGHRRLDLKKVKALLNEKNVSLAHPDKVLTASGCTVGSVPPFGNLFEPPIPVYADEYLQEQEFMVFSAATHNHSVKMKVKDWVEIVQPVIVDIGKEKE